MTTNVGLLLLIAVAQWRAWVFIALSTFKRKTYVCPPRAKRSGWQAETLCVLPRNPFCCNTNCNEASCKAVTVKLSWLTDRMNKLGPKDAGS